MCSVRSPQVGQEWLSPLDIFSLGNNKIYIPECPGDVTSGRNTIKQYRREENEWLEHKEQS